SATHELLGLSETIGPQMHQLTDYLGEIATQFQGSDASGFYMPARALTDPRYVEALHQLTSADGRATHLLVYGDGAEWGGDGAARTDQVLIEIKEDFKAGTLSPTG